MEETERIINDLEYIKSQLVEQFAKNIVIIDGLIDSIKTPLELKKELNAHVPTKTFNSKNNFV